MVRDAPQPARRAGSEQAPRVVVALGRPDRAGRVDRVESPDRILRVLAVLSEAADELRLVALSPEVLARASLLIKKMRAEIERSVSPALAVELHDLLGCGQAEPDAAQLRFEYTALLGWVSGLVIAMLSELENARNEPLVADSYLPEIQVRAGAAAAT